MPKGTLAAALLPRESIGLPIASIGRVVHFVVLGGAHRPALVTACDPATNRANLQVFCDGPNDLPYNVRYENERRLWMQTSPEHRHRLRLAWMPTVWEEQVVFDAAGAQARSWHWPERGDQVGAAAAPAAAALDPAIGFVPILGD